MPSVGNDMSSDGALVCWREKLADLKVPISNELYRKLGPGIVRHLGDRKGHLRPADGGANGLWLESGEKS